MYYIIFTIKEDCQKLYEKVYLKLEDDVYETYQEECFDLIGTIDTYLLSRNEYENANTTFTQVEDTTSEDVENSENYTHELCSDGTSIYWWVISIGTMESASTLEDYDLTVDDFHDLSYYKTLFHADEETTDSTDEETTDSTDE